MPGEDDLPRLAPEFADAFHEIPLNDGFFYSHGCDQRYLNRSHFVQI